MNLLDENIRQDQQTELRRRGMPFRTLREDLAQRGVQDADIIPLLHRLSRPTLFTHDQDFCQRSLAHADYGLVWLDGFDGRAAEFIRRFLKHPAFKTTAQRMGVVAHVHVAGIDCWRRGDATRRHLAWPRR